MENEAITRMKDAAAMLSGKPAESLTAEEASSILKARGIPANVTQFANIATTLLWERLNPMQFEQLLAEEATGGMEKALSDLVTEIAQEEQEDTDLDRITLDMEGYDPKLDPHSPQFDREAWDATVISMGGYEEIADRIKVAMAQAVSPAKAWTQTGPYKDALSALVGNVQKIANEISLAMEKAVADGLADNIQTVVDALRGVAAEANTFTKSDQFKALKEGLRAFREFVNEHQADFAAMEEATAEMRKLKPFILMELEEARNDPDFAKYSIEQIIRKGVDNYGNPTESKWGQLVERARQRQKEQEEAEELIAEVEQVAELPRVISAKAGNRFDFGIDKLSLKLWPLKTANGEGKLEVDTSKKGSNQNAIILLGIDFDNLPEGTKITKQLTFFDKKVYEAIANLYNDGDKIMSLTKIYYRMGNTTPPNKKDLTKINDSITKMGAAHIFVDNTAEVRAQHGKGYDHFVYDASLLPFERITAIINGQLTESAIRPFREPPVASFARGRGQIASAPSKLLEIPLNKTEGNLRLIDYLQIHIGRMKNPKAHAPRKMLYKSIFEGCEITDAKQKGRARDKICTILNHFQECEWIKGYEKGEDGITILL